MKRFFKDALLFAIAFIILFKILDQRTLDSSSTSSTWKYIQSDNPEPIDILFMGNSHAFCDINPTIINQSMDLNTMILSSGSQPIDLTYENLKVLLHYVHPKVIVLEANALLGTTDAIYEKGNEGLLYSNFDGIQNIFYRAGAVIHTISQYDKWPEALSQLVRPANTWTRFDDHTIDPDDAELTINYILGHHPRNKIIKNIDKDTDYFEQMLLESKANDEPLPYPSTIDTLHKFLDLASSNGIPVYIIKTPVLSYGNGLPSLAKVLDELSQTDPAITGYCNFSEQMTLLGMEQDDFSDKGHLNREGANKFTVKLIEWLSEQLSIKYDLSKVTAIKEESFQELPDGNYRYTVSLMDNTLIKFIIKDKSGNITYETEYSDVNYIDIPRISSKNQLFYRICSKTEIPGRVYPFSLIEYNFMHDNGALADFSAKYTQVEQSGNVFQFTNSYDKHEIEYSWVIKKDSTTIKTVKYAEGQPSFKYEFTDPGKYTVYSYIRLKEDPEQRTSVPVKTIIIDDEGNVSN